MLLFAVEIGWFILFPIGRELKAWWALRSTIRERGHVWIAGAVLAGVMGGLFIPWSDRIRVPAVLEATPHATIYTPAAGKIVELAVEQGQQVQAGELLVKVEAPALENEIAVARKRIEVEQLRAQRQSVDQEELNQTRVTLETLRTHISELEGLLEKQRTLHLTAPMTGIVTDREEAIHVGQWINKELPLAYIVDPQGEEVHALVEETEVKYLEVGQSARFIPDDAERPSLPVRVAEIRDTDESSFTVPYLASLYGGEVPVREDAEHKLQPESSVYRVTLRFIEPPPGWNRAVRGTVLVQSRRVSVAQRAWEQGVRIFLRESGA